MTSNAGLLLRLFPLTRRISDRLSPILIRLPVTPNQISAAALAAGLAGALCFISGGWLSPVVGSALLILSYVLDNCDGDIARAKNLRSRFGHYFDSIADSLVDATFFVCLGIGTMAAGEELFWVWLGAFAALGAAISYGLELRHDLGGASDPTATPEQATLPTSITETVVYVFRELTRADFCFIVLILSLADVTWVLLPLGAVGAQAYWLSSLWVRWRRFHV